MQLLEVAADIASRIPLGEPYADEREFCWSILGRAALEVGDESLVRRALAELRDERSQAELRVATLGREGRLREEVLADFFERLGYWETHLFPIEMSALAVIFADRFGVAEASKAGHGLLDPYARTFFLADLADLTSDPLLKRRLLLEAEREASAASLDRDDALEYVGALFADGGLVDDVERVREAVDTPEVRDFLSSELERARTAANQRGVASDSDGGGARQRGLRVEAERIVGREFPDEAPSKLDAYKRMEEMMTHGEDSEAMKLAMEHFATRVCPVTLGANEALLVDLLRVQLEAVVGYHRNDLKVEFLCELAVAFHDRGQAPPSIVGDLIQQDAFAAVEPALPPRLTSRDPSQMEFPEFVRFLFDRPSARTDEEERFMVRRGDFDPETEDPDQLVRLSTLLFQRFGEIAGVYDWAHVDWVVWHLGWNPFWLTSSLGKHEVDRNAVAACIRALYQVFADYVLPRDVPEDATSFHMIWEEFAREAPVELAHVLIETAARVLELDDWHCQYAALHGLNHLRSEIGSPDPRAREVVQAFLDRCAADLATEQRDYAEACRDGKAL